MTARSVQPSRDGTVPWPAEVAARYVAEGYWQGRSLAAYVLDAADANPDAIAVVDGNLRLSYRQLAERADRAALRLRALGLGPRTTTTGPSWTAGCAPVTSCGSVRTATS
jgi:2-hydroxy-7-methoxy-5-methyl-1-naphthoate---CoA ligase